MDAFWSGILGLIAGLVIGAILMFFWFKRYLEKNPPITERQIKEMFKQMGRKPSQKQIKQIMLNMKNNK
ncbi:MAG: YneF family protein [Phytoplasma sp.]|uniref:YneF family protein n=1 Tax=Phytoplasma sp. TaxID=2155 RepID=UPI002B402410|nr:YneF family protein [Phytoplasma sp.]WRH06764.1 MAG: YneF family protein [Phytoplasma sp.]